MSITIILVHTKAKGIKSIASKGNDFIFLVAHLRLADMWRNVMQLKNGSIFVTFLELVNTESGTSHSIIPHSASIECISNNWISIECWAKNIPNQCGNVSLILDHRR